MGKTNAQIATGVSINTIIGNAALSAFKLFAGITAHSSAMISDAVHSLSDVLSTLIVIIGVNLANRDSDKDHPYGHERMECVSAIILSALLFATGAVIGLDGIKKAFFERDGEFIIPGGLALIAAILSIAVKEAMYWYTIAAAKKINSNALRANAWHHRSDALSSVGSFIGILGARLGMPVLDPLAGVVICGFILKVAVEIFIDATRKMTDKACDDEFVEKVGELIMAQDSVLGIDNLKTRLFGNKVYIDVEIKADKDLSLHESHQIAERVHDEIEKNFTNVKHCMVHVNPGE